GEALPRAGRRPRFPQDPQHRGKALRRRGARRRDDRQAHLLRALDRGLRQHPVPQGHPDADGAGAEDEGGRGALGWRRRSSGGAHAMTIEGLTTTPSRHGPAETMERLAAAVTARGIAILARIDHAAAAAAVGMTLRPTAVLIFGNPKAGTPLMQ